MKWVRPLISLMFMFSLSIGWFMSMVSTDAFIGQGAVAVTWWFKSRDEEKKNGQ